MTPARPCGIRNPIFLRYCRSRLRPHKFSAMLLLVLLISSFIVALGFSLGLRGGLSEADSARVTLIPLLVFQGFLLFAIGTAQAAGGMVAERDEGQMDYQRMVPMSPGEKVFGYLFGLPVCEYALFASTLPFTAWALWTGGVAASAWVPLYCALMTSAVLYHLTGMVTGTVVTNRRWAFLVSIGLVFSLYTVVPLAGRVGLGVFQYFSLAPVFQASLPGLLPRDSGALMETRANLLAGPGFFGLKFSAFLFTLFCQSGLIAAFVAMLRRRWLRPDAKLLGKFGALGLFVWVQLLLLGTALPQIPSSAIFPSRSLMEAARMSVAWKPGWAELVVLCGVYGTVTLILVWILGGLLLTPGASLRQRAVLRARRLGREGVPFWDEGASATGFAAAMAVLGGLGWFLFSRLLLESRWFPGQILTPQVGALYIGVLLAGGLALQTILERFGGRTALTAAMLAGVAPLMVAAVLSAISEHLLPVAVWVGGISPLSLPTYAAAALLPVAEPDVSVARALPRAFAFWLVVWLIADVWLRWGWRNLSRNPARSKDLQ